MKPICSYLLATALGTGATSCSSDTSSHANSSLNRPTAQSVLVLGPWRGVLSMQGQEVPFLFEVKTADAKPVVYLINQGPHGKQRLRCGNVSTYSDSIVIPMPANDARLVFQPDGKHGLRGFWQRLNWAAGKFPVRAVAGRQPLFVEKPLECIPPIPPTFRMDKPDLFAITTTNKRGKPYRAVGAFQMPDYPQATAAFPIEGGKLDYLAGQLLFEQGQYVVRLSKFDGSHASLIITRPIPSPNPKYKGDISRLQGDFYSSNAGHKTWKAVLEYKTNTLD